MYLLQLYCILQYSLIPLINILFPLPRASSVSHVKIHSSQFNVPMFRLSFPLLGKLNSFEAIPQSVITSSVFQLQATLPLIRSFSRPKIKFINPSQETPSLFLQTPSLLYVSVHGTIHSTLSIPRVPDCLFEFHTSHSLRHWCPLFSTRGNLTRKNFRGKVLYEQVESTLASSNDIPLSILGGCHYCMYNHTLGNHFPIIQYRGILRGPFPTYTYIV